VDAATDAQVPTEAEAAFRERAGNASTGNKPIEGRLRWYGPLKKKSVFAAHDG